jgi:hypothetical protein|tara:strand:+ start:2380 stop:2880 length:501 start_codon:yes stop_codon:yes gene_type:complete
MKYFNDCQNLDEAKNLFKTLVFKLHPDTSGYDSQQDFIVMHAEFKTVSSRLKFATGYKTDQDFNADKFYDVLRKFDGLNDININFVGSFIWLEDEVKGATYEQKEAIKAIQIDGLNSARFAGKKKAWYFSPEGYKQRAKSGKTLEQIKNTYGCNSFKTKKGKYLAA